MSNTNTNLQTQTSNALHNAIMEAGGKDHLPMLAPCNYNLPYKFKWTEKTVLVAEGSLETTTKGYTENYKNVSQDIRNQLDAKAEAVQIILTGIDNDIYSIVDACPNACEMWKSIERLKQGKSINVQDLETNLYWEFGKFTSRDGESLESYYSRNRGKAIVDSPPPIYDQEPTMVTEDDEMSKEKEIDKLRALISLSFKKIYKPTNNNLQTSSNTSRANQDNSPRINRGTGYDNQRTINVAKARENVGTQVVQQSGIQCYNCKEYGHVARECQKPKWAKDAAYHKEKMLLFKRLLQMLLTILDPSLIPSRCDSTNGETVNQDDNDLAKERELLASLLRSDWDQVDIDSCYENVICLLLLIEKLKCVSRPYLKSNRLEDRVLHTNSEGKKQQVEDHHRNFKFSNNKTSVTAYNDSLNAKTSNLIEIILFIIDSGCSKHMMGNLKLLSNFVEKFLGMVKFRNDQIAPILGYGDLVQGKITIKRVYYVEGLNHNLFSVGQFCDADLEVAFRNSTCYVRDLKGNDLLTSFRGTDLYFITC
ncbi:ribonuclease H-like domain-containing protein [Tanacetum coccineum]